MDILERYNMLEEMKNDLESIVERLDIKYMDNYISELLFTIDEIEKEMKEIEPQLIEDEQKENDEREREYIESQLGGGYY